MLGQLVRYSRLTYKKIGEAFLPNINTNNLECEKEYPHCKAVNCKSESIE